MPSHRTRDRKILFLREVWVSACGPEVTFQNNRRGRAAALGAIRLWNLLNYLECFWGLKVFPQVLESFSAGQQGTGGAFPIFVS